MVGSEIVNNVTPDKMLTGFKIFGVANFNLKKENPKYLEYNIFVNLYDVIIPIMYTTLKAILLFPSTDQT